MPWSEVQRLSDAGVLPVAIVDGEIRARAKDLAAYVENRGRCDALPLVNARAQLMTAEAEPRKIPPVVLVCGTEFTRVPQSTLQMAATPTMHCLQPDAEMRRRVDKLTRENQELAADNNLLRGQLDQMRSYRESEREYSVRAARNILSGHMEEARVIAEELDGELKEVLRELDTIVSQRLAVEKRLNDMKTRMEADIAQTQVLCQQQEAATEEELAQAQKPLAALTQSLRELPRRTAQTGEASDLTQHQLESLSEFL